MKRILSIIALACLLGCASNTPTNVAYKTEGALTASVNASMSAWADYVKGNHGVTQSQIDAVKKGYEAYYGVQMSAKAAVDAYLAVQSPENSNMVAQVTVSVGQSAASLIQVINSFTKGKP